ncbi:hypothetical protein KPL71_026989 [Citrus sinensis]|uniref:Uncharacterized protein n=1 Tax=Citrus sinensis TaxID=2711 RepID=A0ACB8I387_CITSI|nr:hypothetical protein KPL71_026989 [Citrus sinensis]
MKMTNQYRNLIVILVVLTVVQTLERNGDNEEEDDDWKEWGKPKISGPDMDIPQMQEEMLKLQCGPVFGFVKLRLCSTPRSVAEVMEIATKWWSKVLKTGSIEVKFMAIDFVTIMFTLQRGKLFYVMEFLLNQPEAYEVKIEDQAYRKASRSSS